MAKKSKKKSWFKKLKNKYRFVLINDLNFEEKFSFRLTRLNLFLFGGLFIIILFVLTFIIIANTGLRNMIDSSSNIEMDRLAYKNQQRLDSQLMILQQYELYVSNLQRVMQGEDIEDITTNYQPVEQNDYDTIRLRRSKEDSLLRAEYSQEDQYSLITGNERSSASGIYGYIFFTPLKGTVVNGFNPSANHYAVDIVSKTNEAIKATLPGTVILSTWSVETGYTIAIQHAGNIVSVYKHNSALLKSQGTYVAAGEAIAIYGGSGTLSSGPHLHFELWLNGNPVDPENFMVF